jgi:hypothetical protein
MQDILRAFYQGKIKPDEMESNTQTYQDALIDIQGGNEMLMEKLTDPNDKLRLEQMVNGYQELLHEQSITAFSDGFVLCALLALEILQKSERYTKQ